MSKLQLHAKHRWILKIYVYEFIHTLKFVCIWIKMRGEKDKIDKQIHDVWTQVHKIQKQEKLT